MIELFAQTSVFPRAELGELCEIKGGYPAPQNDAAFKCGEIPFVRMKDVGRWHFTNNLCTTDQKLNKAHFEAGRYELTPKGSILMPRSGSVGLNHRAILTVDAVVVSHLCALLPKTDRVDVSYLYHFLCCVDMRKLTKKTTGLDSIAFSDVKRVSIPLPPLPEQRRIATILDQADALRAKRREALAQLDSLTQSIFIEMFGDPVTNAKGWQVVKLGSHTTKMGSGSTPTGGDAAYKESGTSLIRSLNVHDGEFVYKNLAHIDEQQAAKLANVKVEANDVLLNITGASVARVCRAPADVLPARVNQHVMIIRPKVTINSTYLERLLLTPQIKLRLLQIGGAGATREAITKAQAEELHVICPPIDLQREFERRCLSLTTIGARQSESSVAMDDLFSSLQHRAFRGEL